MHANTSQLLKQNTSIIKGHFASFNIFFFLFSKRAKNLQMRDSEREMITSGNVLHSRAFSFFLLSFCVSSALEPAVDSPSFSRRRVIVQCNEACKRSAFVRMITYFLSLFFASFACSIDFLLFVF